MPNIKQSGAKGLFPRLVQSSFADPHPRVAWCDAIALNTSLAVSVPITNCDSPVSTELRIPAGPRRAIDQVCIIFCSKNQRIKHMQNACKLGFYNGSKRLR